MIDHDPPFSLLLCADKLAHHPQEIVRELDATPRAILAQDYGIVSVEVFRLSLTASAEGKNGEMRLRGRIDARTIQNCVITLEPIEAEHSVEVNVVFSRRKGAKTKDTSEVVLDTASMTDDEEERIFYEHSPFDAAPVLCELFSLAIDPFPRKPGAELDWHDPHDLEDTTPSPFAKLARLNKSRTPQAGKK